MNTLKNKVNLIGRLGAKPETRTLNGGYVFSRFSLATNEPYKDKEGNWKDNTQWHNVTAWGKIAERVNKVLEKGSEIALEGRLVNKQYENKAGEKCYSSEIEINNFMLIKQKTAN